MWSVHLANAGGQLYSKFNLLLRVARSLHVEVCEKKRKHPVRSEPASNTWT